MSSCVFILPWSFTSCHLRSYLLVCLCHYTAHHIHYTDPCLLSVSWFSVMKKEMNIFIAGPYLTSIPSIMLRPSVICIINMGSLIFDCHLCVNHNSSLNCLFMLRGTLKISSSLLFSSGGVLRSHTPVLVATLWGDFRIRKCSCQMETQRHNITIKAVVAHRCNLTYVWVSHVRTR